MFRAVHRFAIICLSTALSRKQSTGESAAYKVEPRVISGRGCDPWLDPGLDRRLVASEHGLGADHPGVP